MCGTYGFSIDDAKDVYSRFEIEKAFMEVQKRYKITPGQVNPVVTRHSPNSLEPMFWGLIPYFAKDSKFDFNTINARAERVADAPSYRKPFRNQRCIIPMTHFYEPDKSVKPSIPWLFKLKDQEMFGVAGLYDIWKDPRDGKEITSYTLITTEANEIVGRVHHRMPVILPKEDEDAWLNPDMVEPEHIQEFLKPYPSELMESYRVTQSLWKRIPDSEEFIKPFKVEQTQGSLLD
jgi:putative SOS response-associated peptidase YedK